jgi:hypothetical protein
MKMVFALRATRPLIVAGAGMLAVAAAHAGPQVTFYVTIPLGGPTTGHVLGLRLDRESSPPAIGNINPASPLNRRALLDLQLGAHSALRLELDRRLTWDINRLQWHESSLPATFTLRVPTRETRSKAEAHVDQAASLAYPFQDQARKPVVKLLAVEP